jgi:hypothetical protein
VPRVAVTIVEREQNMTTQEGYLPGEQAHRMEDAGRRLGRKADEVGARVETAVRDKVHGLEAAGARLQHGISVTGERVKTRVEGGRERVVAQVQDHPVRTLLYAFGAGALIGLMMGTRSRRR